MSKLNEARALFNDFDDDDAVRWNQLRNILEVVESEITTIYERIGQMAEATQADIDALTTQVNQVASDLQGAQSNLQNEIDQLAASGVDVSGLQAALAPLDAQVSALNSIQPSGPTPAPTPPAPTPTPTPEPTPAPTPPAPTGPTQSVYTFTGDPTTIDATQWTPSGFQTATTPPSPLYYYSGDANPGDTNGNGQDNGAWQVYAGDVAPAA